MYCDDIERLERLRTLAVQTEKRLWASERELSAKGIDVPAEVQRLRNEMARLEAHHSAADTAYEKLLQSLADLADARRELYRALELLVAKATEKYSETPEIAQARRLLEKLRLEMPRSN
jgi:hypothetical protein